MNEGLEETRTEDLAAEVPQTLASQRISWLRFAYCCEFLIGLICTFAVWSQVGGQGHLDLLPWYIKLVCGLALSWSTVRLTAGMVEQEKAWNRRTRGWLFAMVAAGMVMAAITFYYHLHEVPDEPDTDETSTATSVSAAEPAGSMSPI